MDKLHGKCKIIAPQREKDAHEETVLITSGIVEKETSAPDMATFLNCKTDENGTHAVVEILLSSSHIENEDGKLCTLFIKDVYLPSAKPQKSLCHLHMSYEFDLSYSCEISSCWTYI